MTNLLGLVLFVVFIFCVIGTAAGITWIVVKFSPSRDSGRSSSS